MRRYRRITTPATRAGGAPPPAHSSQRRRLHHGPGTCSIFDLAAPLDIAPGPGRRRSPRATSGAPQLQPLASTLLAGEQAAPAITNRASAETPLDRTISALQDALSDGDPLTQGRNAANSATPIRRRVRPGTRPPTRKPKRCSAARPSTATPATSMPWSAWARWHLARHEFRDARQCGGERAVNSAPQHAAAYGVLA